MKRNVVACLCTMAAVNLMAACQQLPDAAKTLDPSGLKLGGDAIVYNTNEKDVPWLFDDVNPCNGDAISITGNSHFVIHVGFDSNGGLHYSSNVVSKGTGLGSPSGKTYKIMDQEKFSEQAPANPQGFVIVDRQEVKVNGPTTGDDYTSSFMDQVTVDRTNGMPTTDVKKDTSSCK